MYIYFLRTNDNSEAFGSVVIAHPLIVILFQNLEFTDIKLWRHWFQNKRE